MKHRHAELIKAWADGKTIQVKQPWGWADTPTPLWTEDTEYRIKPDSVIQSLIDAYKNGETIQYRANANYATTWFNLHFLNPKDIETYMFDMVNLIWRIKPNDTEYKFIFRYNNPSNDIEDILDCFDFNKVKKVMDFLNWEWCFGGVPEIWDLRKKARSLLKEVAEKSQTFQTCDRDSYYVTSGGFRAEANIYKDDPKIHLRLVFELSDWDNFHD